MKSEYHITVKDFCHSHDIEESFVLALIEYELIAIRNVQEVNYIHYEELPNLERLVRLRHELGINLEGIEAIHYLLQRVEQMQRELNTLRNKLDIHEDF